MANNYCANCGEKLSGEELSCASCGEPVPSPSVQAEPADEEDFSRFADLSGFDIIGTYPAYAPPQPKAASAAGQTGLVAVEAPASPEPEPRRGWGAKRVAGAVAIVLVAGIMGLLANPHAREVIQQRLPIQDVAQAQEGQDIGVSASAEASRMRSETLASVHDAEAVMDEDQAFEVLLGTYDKLQSYNERVYSCLQTYNSVIVVSDQTQRETAAGIAKGLLAEIEKDLDGLDALGIGRASDLYDDYANVRRLLDDQYQRLASIVESWDISLSYRSPYEHQDEILEPLRRDADAEGQNSYLADFDETYWDSRPSR